MRLVGDTNVVVSGILNPHGPPGRILDGLLSNRLILVFDDRILAEYSEVLARPRFRFEATEVARILNTLVADGERVTAAPMRVELPDAADLPFLEVAQAGGAPLVTGNIRHFPPGSRANCQVLTPAQYLDLWAACC